MREEDGIVYGGAHQNALYNKVRQVIHGVAAQAAGPYVHVYAGQDGHNQRDGDKDGAEVNGHNYKDGQNSHEREDKELLREAFLQFLVHLRFSNPVVGFREGVIGQLP